MERIDRVNQQVKREIGKIIQKELSDPRFEFVSITGADVSKDLRSAKIYFSVLGNESQVESAKKGFESASGIIRGWLGKSIKIRYTPELKFYYDKSIEFGSNVEQTLKEIKDEHEGS